MRNCDFAQNKMDEVLTSTYIAGKWTRCKGLAHHRISHPDSRVPPVDRRAHGNRAADAAEAAIPAGGAEGLGGCRDEEADFLEYFHS